MWVKYAVASDYLLIHPLFVYNSICDTLPEYKRSFGIIALAAYLGRTNSFSVRLTSVARKPRIMLLGEYLCANRIWN